MVQLTIIRERFTKKTRWQQAESLNSTGNTLLQRSWDGLSRTRRQLQNCPVSVVDLPGKTISQSF